MDKTLQDLAWSCLPKEFKEEVKKEYRKGYVCETLTMLITLFGRHNLTSDAEGEEMLTVSRNNVMAYYRDAQEDEEKYHPAGENACNNMYQRAVGRRQMLKHLFGSECLPDELNEDNFAKSEPKPAEPKNDGTRQKQYVPKNAESGTHSFNHILKDGFREHNRLHIAAMAMQGLLSNADRMNKYEYVATEPPCDELAVVVARAALRYADVLIAECEKGDNHA